MQPIYIHLYILLLLPQYYNLYLYFSYCTILSWIFLYIFVLTFLLLAKNLIVINYCHCVYENKELE